MCRLNWVNSVTTKWFVDVYNSIIREVARSTVGAVPIWSVINFTTCITHKCLYGNEICAICRQQLTTALGVLRRGLGAPGDSLLDSPCPSPLCHVSDEVLHRFADELQSKNLVLAVGLATLTFAANTCTCVVNNGGRISKFKFPVSIIRLVSSGPSTAYAELAPMISTCDVI